jgi:hypothetical protein
MTYDELAQQLRALASEFPALAESALQALRVAFEASADPFKRRLAIGAQIGAAKKPDWREALVRLRDLYEVRTLADMVSEIDKAFARSPDDGWAAWLRWVAEAVLQFRPRYEIGLCAPAFPFDASRQAAVAHIRRAVGCMVQSRWEELGEDVTFLAAQGAVRAGSGAADCNTGPD